MSQQLMSIFCCINNSRSTHQNYGYGTHRSPHLSAVCIVQCRIILMTELAEQERDNDICFGLFRIY